MEKLIIDKKLPNAKLTERREELFKQYKENSAFYSTLITSGLSDDDIHENVGILHDYFVQFNKCENCDGLNNCPADPKYVIASVKKENNQIVFTYGYCDKYLKSEKMKRLFIVSDFDKKYLDFELSKIDRTAIRAPLLTDLIKKFLDSNYEQNLFYIFGKHKSGTTTISATFFKEYVIKYELSGMYLDCFTRIGELNSLFFTDKDNFAKKFAEICNVSILVLSKISSAYFNDFTRDNILYPLLVERVKNNRLTIITSELNIDEFGELINGKGYKLQIRSKQVVDLLKEFKQYDITDKIGVY